MSKDQLQTQSYVIMGILILQYLFGMAVNLFVQFPDSKNEGQLWEFAQSQWYLIVHIFFALGLLISGVVLLIRAIRRKDRNWIIAGGVGLFWILVAFMSGVQFVPTQQDVYSYVMAAAFILAVASYGWGLYKAKK
jgi:hypothetical protein